jgi:hypothetical protein
MQPDPAWCCPAMQTTQHNTTQHNDNDNDNTRRSKTKRLKWIVHGTGTFIYSCKKSTVLTICRRADSHCSPSLEEAACTHPHCCHRPTSLIHTSPSWKEKLKMVISLLFSSVSGAWFLLFLAGVFTYGDPSEVCRNVLA